MVKKSFLNLSRVVLEHRLLWTLLLLLTAIILLFPVHLRYEYHAIESVYVFGNNLPLFGILFYVWLGILLLLLFSKDKNSEWQRLALVCIFALVFFGFWAINTPTGGHWDELWNMAHVKYLQETGHIAPLHSNVNYFLFPALHLTAFSISEIGGLGIFATRTLFILFSSLLFAVLSYLLFMKLLKNSYLASLAVLLMVASLVASQGFQPRFTPAFPLLILILVILAWREDRALGMGTSMALIMIILLAAFTISYLPLPACFILILAGIYLLQSVAKKGVAVWSTIALFVTVFLAWEIYYATAFFDGLVGLVPAFIEGFMSPLERLFSGYSAILAPNVTEVVPLWAKAIKFFWLALIIGFGAILGIWNLVRARKLSSTEVLENGGLLGVIVFFIVGFLTPSEQMHGTRALAYLPLFTIPIMLRFLSRFSTRGELSLQNTPPENSGGGLNSNGLRSFGNLWGWFRKHVFTLLIVLFFILSLPVFLIQYSRISSEAVYSYECSAGEFVESAYGSEDLNLFSEAYTRLVYTYYAPEAHFQNAWPARNGEELFEAMNSLIDAFENSGGGNAIFVLSERFRQPPHQPAIVEPTDPGWLEVINRLAQNNKIYDNGHIELYERLAK